MNSDETGKAGWTTVEVTGLLDNASLSATGLEIYLMAAGECLIDDVQVLDVSENSLVANGSFASGLAPWIMQGNHDTSFWQPSGGVNGGGCLHVLAAGKGDASMNRLRVPLTSGLSSGSTATLRAKVRWLRGHPQILLRLHGNGLEAFGNLVVPFNTGTPGLSNSQATANSGPAIYDVTHRPVLPWADEPVVVTARMHDPDDLSQASVHYRIDPDTALGLTIPLLDDGTGGDAVAGDGL
jgi:hypothetical protein